MLRLLLLVACFLFANNTVAQNKYIRVTGEGSSIEQAKENAFKTAVQQRVGAVVLSERQANAGKLSKDDISMFSAGYVEDFKLIEIIQTNSTVRVTLDVLVAESKLLNQTLSTGRTSQDANGERAGVALSTYLDQKQKGDNMLDTVLATYPQNAFTITQKPFTLSVDSYRTAVIQVPYAIKWNYDYIVAFNEAISLLVDNRFGMLEPATRNVIVMVKDPKDFLFGKKNHYKLSDIPTFDRIKNSMTYDREIRISLVINDNSGNSIFKICYIPDSLSGRKNPFYSMGEPRTFFLYGNETESGVLTLSINPKYNYIIQQMSTIEINVVPNSKCEK